MWYLNLNFYMKTLEEGMAFVLLAMGVYITFRILDFADLTVEGSFPLGAAVAAKSIVSGLNPVLATIFAFLAGCIAGMITGIINTRLKIAGLLAGILTMTSLYSINLRIMGKSQISLFRKPRIFDGLERLFGSDYGTLISLIIIVFIVKILLDFFLHTEFGMSIRATGDNPVMIETLGINTDFIKIFGLALANGMVALSGALFAQYSSSADVQMGMGMIVVGLASVIIGEVFVRTSKIPFATSGVILGAVLYRFAIAVSLRLGFDATDLKIVTAVLVIIALGAPSLRRFLIQDEFAEKLLEEVDEDA